MTVTRAFLIVTVLMAVVTAAAYGHVERSSYWPNPAPDTGVKPAAGGKVPKARTLASALRPSQGSKKLSGRNARRLRRLNRAFAKRCKFKSIQTAIKRARNNDRVIIMPGRYMEPKSRRQPTDDPKCQQYE